MTPELLPCPFCGGEASGDGYVFYPKPCKVTAWEDGSPITEAFFCNCPKCGISNMASSMGYRTKTKAIAAWNRRAPLPTAALAEVPEVRAADFDSFYELVLSAVEEADRAMRKFPQPNYVISKVAEEAGEVVKAAIHCAENRETAENVRGEMRQLIAMLYRLWVEGDQVHGLAAIREGRNG